MRTPGEVTVPAPAYVVQSYACRLAQAPRAAGDRTRLTCTHIECVGRPLKGLDPGCCTQDCAVRVSVADVVIKLPSQLACTDGQGRRSDVGCSTLERLEPTNCTGVDLEFS